MVTLDNDIWSRAILGKGKPLTNKERKRWQRSRYQIDHNLYNHFAKKPEKKRRTLLRAWHLED